VTARRGDSTGDLFAAAHSAAAQPMQPGEAAATAIAVSTLTGLVKEVVEGSVPALWIRGEVTGLKQHRNGHWYFTLRDADAQLRCVVWFRHTQRIPAPPDEGMQVAAFGRLGVHAARAEVQFSIVRLEAAGDGLWQKAFERARARLDKDGLLAPERKRALPRFPRTIAVVTSPDGAALHDIVAVARRRDPGVVIVVVAATVQGDTAPDELVRAIERVGRWRRADLVIIGRGGGSREDLRAFNDERVARAVAACPMPTISAVGHEVDVSLCDLVADVRAATPSAAAEAAVRVRTEVVAELSRTGRRMRTALANRAGRARAELSRAGRELALRGRRTVEMRRAWWAALRASLDALSPLKTLDRGYAVARAADGAPLMSIGDFSAGDAFTLVVRDGEVAARTLRTTPKDA
jgi:exodeoxyribonuclease VII large subunit